MKMYIITNNVIEGFHKWKKAPEEISHLRNRHRHLFYIICEFSVNHGDREIEIQTMQKQIKQYIHKNYGNPAEFGNLSCEMIAMEIINHYENCSSCKVLEDNEGGAIVRKEV